MTTENKKESTGALVEGINFCPEFLPSRERSIKKMKDIKPEVKVALEMSIKRGNEKLMQQTKNK